MKYILIMLIMNYNGVGLTTAEFNSYDKCMIAGNSMIDGTKAYVKFECVEK